MNRSIRVAALQLRAHDREDFARTADGIFAAAEEASAGAELVVLPEGTFPAYVLGDARVDDAAIAAAVERLGNLARATRTVFVAGVAHRAGGSLRNAAIVIDRDGTIAGRADKLFLWHFDRRWFEAGDRLEPVRTAAGTLGIMICADGRVPTIARTLVDRGADMLVMPTAWVTSGRNPDALENVQADLLARVRAFENGVPFVAANKCGAELGAVAYCGKSQVVDATGTVVAIASERWAETVKAVVTVGTGTPHRAAPARVAPRAAALETPVRVGISAQPLPQDAARLLDLVDDAYAIAPGATDRFAALDKVLPAVRLGDAEMLDPGVLASYRRAGYRIAVWNVGEVRAPWIESIARARALELRVYVVVVDEGSDRAFAVDPDGAIVCGTFDDFRIASFSLDPRRTIETTVAPGTDIVDGLELVASIVIRTDKG